MTMVTRTRMKRRLAAVERLGTRFSRYKEAIDKDMEQMQGKTAVRIATEVLGQTYRELVRAKKRFRQEKETLDGIKDWNTRNRKLDELTRHEIRTLAKMVICALDKKTDEVKIVVVAGLETAKILVASYNPECRGDYCEDVRTYLMNLGLNKYLERDSSQSNVGRQAFADALKKLDHGVGHETFQRAKEVEGKIERLKAIEETAGVHILMEHAGLEYREVEEAMPDFVEFVKEVMKRDRSSVRFATVDLQTRVGVLITDEWAYYGSGGSEYGSRVIVYRGGETQEEYFKYRHPYSSTADRWELAFGHAELLEVTPDRVTVKLKSLYTDRPNDPLTRTYAIKEGPVAKVDKEAFRRRLREVKEALVERWSKTATATYPKRYSLEAARAASLAQDIQNTGMGDSVHYDKPEIIDEYVKASEGRAVLVVKAQIDALPVRGKEYAWVVYEVTMTGEKELDRKCYYEAALAEFGGQRIIRMKASEWMEDEEKVRREGV